MTFDRSERAVAPVVGVALVIAITVILAAVVGTSLFGIGLGSATAPQVTVTFDVVDDEIVLTHESGEPLRADEIVILDQHGTVIGGLQDDMTAGDRAVVVEDTTDVELIRLVWQEPGGDTETILETYKL